MRWGKRQGTFRATQYHPEFNLRETLKIGDDIPDPVLRTQELRNRVDRLVLPEQGNR